jgi:hypothetical protein
VKATLVSGYGEGVEATAFQNRNRTGRIMKPKLLLSLCSLLLLAAEALGQPNPVGVFAEVSGPSVLRAKESHPLNGRA